MRVCGVICEYDPFHRGHEHHLALSRQQTKADYILCVMSGAFTQRGQAALFSPFARAEMALRCGADIVLQLPYAFSVREAEYFALGGVGILEALHCVDFLSFGCEVDDLSLLKRAALMLEEPDERMEAALKDGLNSGLSYAAAQGKALAGALGIPPETLTQPNCALALAYLRALLRLKSPIRPLAVMRQGTYHAREIEAFPSAAAVRGAVLRGDWASVRRAVPAAAYPVLEGAVMRGEFCSPERMDALFLRPLLCAEPKALSALPGIAEGMENRLAQAAQSAVSREDVITRMKTRRYTRGRIARALCHAAMGVAKGDLPAVPDHARILGFRESARPLLRRMQGSGFPLVTSPAGEKTMALDLRADALWALGARRPQGETYRRGPVILRE